MLATLMLYIAFLLRNFATFPDANQRPASEVSSRTALQTEPAQAATSTSLLACPGDVLQNARAWSTVKYLVR